MKREMQGVYKKKSPSIRKFDERFLRLRKALFLDRLKLPLALFKGSTVLEFGAGTGETGLPFAMMGAYLEAVELNPISCGTLNDFFAKHGYADRLAKVHNTDFDDFRTSTHYDFAIAEGCLYLADNPGKAFDNLVSGLKPGGFVIVAIPESMGSFQDMLRRFLLAKVSDGTEESIVRNARILFADALERAHKAGGRPIDNIIYDKYIHTTHVAIGADQVLEWFARNAIRYYSSTPDLLTFHCNDTHYQQPIELTAAPASGLVSLSRLFLSKTSDYDIDRVAAKAGKLAETNKLIREIDSLNPEILRTPILSLEIDAMAQRVKKLADLNFEDLMQPEDDCPKTMKEFFGEVVGFLHFLKANNIDAETAASFMAKQKHLFKGFVGNPSQYYVGYRPEE